MKPRKAFELVICPCYFEGVVNFITKVINIWQTGISLVRTSLFGSLRTHICHKTGVAFMPHSEVSSWGPVMGEGGC